MPFRLVGPIRLASSAPETSSTHLDILQKNLHRQYPPLATPIRLQDRINLLQDIARLLGHVVVGLPVCRDDAGAVDDAVVDHWAVSEASGRWRAVDTI